MSLTLHEKLRYIDEKVLFQRVAYDLLGLAYEETQQIHCPYHTDSVASSRVYIYETPNSGAGIYCWVCGNFSTSGVAIKTLGGIPQALDYFKDNFNIDFDEIQGISKDTHLDNKAIAKIVNKAKIHSTKFSWSAKDINRLSHFIKNYGDKFHNIRLESLENKLESKQ